jgi:hypothetical protein
MKYDLEKDLEKVDLFFNLRKGSREGFISKLTFEINSNSYVRVLQEAIEKKFIPGYDIITDIKMIINSDKKDIKYGLNVYFDKL